MEKLFEFFPVQRHVLLKDFVGNSFLLRACLKNPSPDCVDGMLRAIWKGIEISVTKKSLPYIPIEECGHFTGALARLMKNLEKEPPPEEKVDPFMEDVSKIWGPFDVCSKNLTTSDSGSILGKYVFIRKNNSPPEMKEKSKEVCILKEAAYGSGFMIFTRLAGMVATFYHLDNKSDHMVFVTMSMSAIKEYLLEESFADLPWKNKRHAIDRICEWIFSLLFFGAGKIHFSRGLNPIGWVPGNLFKEELMDSSQGDLFALMNTGMRSLKAESGFEMLDDLVVPIYRGVELSETIYGKPKGLNVLFKPWSNLIGREIPDFGEALIQECKNEYGTEWQGRRKEVGEAIANQLEQTLQGPHVLSKNPCIGQVLAHVVGSTITMPIVIFLLSLMGYGVSSTIPEQADKEWGDRVADSIAGLFAVLNCASVDLKQAQVYLTTEALGPETNDPKLKILQQNARTLVRDPKVDSILWWAELFINRMLYMFKPKALTPKGSHFKAGKNLLFSSMGTVAPGAMMMIVPTYLAIKDLKLSCEEVEDILTIK